MKMPTLGQRGRRVFPVLAFVLFSGFISAQERADRNEKPKPPPSSYLPVTSDESLSAVIKRMEAEKPAIAKRQSDLLEQRYDLTDRPSKSVKMSRGKVLQEGVRVRLPDGMTWDKLSKMSPADIRKQNSFPHGFLSLPHPNHPEGGMVFPKFHIEEIKKQEGRDLTRFDLDFDLPDHFHHRFT
jgi:cytochrome c peroxidase